MSRPSTKILQIHQRRTGERSSWSSAVAISGCTVDMRDKSSRQQRSLSSVTPISAVVESTPVGAQSISSNSGQLNYWRLFISRQHAHATPRLLVDARVL